MRRRGKWEREKKKCELGFHGVGGGSSEVVMDGGGTGGECNCNTADCFQDCRLSPQTNTSLFRVFYPHSHAY